jgi:ParB-like chromosome segregation protein Spo0J
MAMEEREAALGFHPAADLLSLLEGAEFDSLVADIRAHGLRDPITLLDGAILDGRNRYRACRVAGVEPRFKEWAPRHEGDTPVAFVVSCNLERRHLNESQRALMAARLASLHNGVRRGRAQAASIQAATTQSEAAKILKVGRSSVQRAAVVLRTASPKLVEAVARGQVPVSTASKLAVLSEAEQVKIAGDVNPRRAARQMLEQFGAKAPASGDISRVIAQLTVELEKIPSTPMRDGISLVDEQRITSYEDREKLAEAVRAAVDRLAALANRIEEPNFCAYKGCQMGFRGRRKKHVPGKKYCSWRCAELAGDYSAWPLPRPST